MTALRSFPDRGIASKKMHGKTADKFCITILFTCSAEGEKLEPFFIGKYAMPRAFQKIPPNRRGILYRNNKTAWMNELLFTEWVRNLDLEMQRQGRKILLLMDNFSAHYIEYEPKNVQLEYLSPNLTSHVQPLDAGIIRTFKALYKRETCIRAVELEEAGVEDIWKINILEAIMQAKRCWKEVKVSTIRNCWNHTGIQPRRCVTHTLPAQSRLTLVPHPL